MYYVVNTKTKTVAAVLDSKLNRLAANSIAVYFQFISAASKGSDEGSAGDPHVIMVQSELPDDVVNNSTDITMSVTDIDDVEAWAEHVAQENVYGNVGTVSEKEIRVAIAIQDALHSYERGQASKG